jgi:hypothetical protein
MIRLPEDRILWGYKPKERKEWRGARNRILKNIIGYKDEN